MGLIDLPSSREFLESVDWVIPSDQRDFTRSTPDWAITFPRDSNIVDDNNDDSQFIKHVQKVMKANTISFPYAGPVDGKKSGKWYEHLINTLIQFGWALKKKFPNKTIPQIVHGNSINPKGFSEALNLLHGKEEDKEEIKEEPILSDVKSFQEFFSSHQPVIGSLYNGPIDGKINDQLESAAIAAENAIANAINNDAIHGTLFNKNNKSFNTSVSDLKTALNIIVEHKGEKVSFLDSRGRILAFSSILYK